jgi:hypothetical protein
MPTVKCGECGFVALRDELGTGALEVNKATRTTGRRTISSGTLINADPFCYKNSPAFVGCNLQLSTHSGTPKGSDHPVVAMLDKSRECDRFRFWLPGKSPQEHEQMSFYDEVRLRTQADKEEARRIADARHFQNIIVSIFTALVAVGALVVSIVAITKR